MFLMVITLATMASAAKLHVGQQSPRGAAEAGGGQFLSTPNQDIRRGSYPGPNAPIVAILSYDNQPHVEDGSYSYRKTGFSFSGDNGIQAQETGSQGGPEAGTSAQGAYTYISPDGLKIALSYIAGEGGFIPQGDHIPTPPPIPEKIQKALAQNAADEAAGIFDDGLYKSARPSLSRLG